MNVTPQYLMQGAALALGQCSLLLRDSVRLYETESFSSALVLAAYAREELGKCRDYLDLAEQLDQGKIAKVGLDQVIKVTKKDHVTKQERAKLSIVMRAPNDSELGKVMMRHSKAIISGESPTDDTLDLLESARRKLAQRVSSERHEQRIRALYVEPSSSGSGWESPKDFPKADVTNFLIDAVNDYSTFKQGIGPYHQEFAKFLEENKDNVSPLPPQWPGHVKTQIPKGVPE